MSVAVWMTRDGGRSWSTHTLPTPAGLSPKVQCVSISDCWVQGEHGIFFTRDGGRTWRSQRSPSFRSDLIDDFECTTVRRCWLEVVPNLSSDHTPERIFATSDGGRDWTQALRLSNSSEGLSDLSCNAPRTCWAFESLPTGERILSTDDGWSHWRARKLPHELELALIRCSTAEVCYALGTRIAELSTDGGEHWRVVPLPRQVAAWGAVAAISCPTATRCWAVGVAGLALTSQGFVGTPGGIIATAMSPR
ncbi:MAG: WD40/YVTN/BNR-like repeat-containing protein [Solirubrobacteraceae bacterium]